MFFSPFFPTFTAMLEVFRTRHWQLTVCTAANRADFVGALLKNAAISLGFTQKMGKLSEIHGIYRIYEENILVLSHFIKV